MKPYLPAEAYEHFRGQLVALVEEEGGEGKVYVAAATFEELQPKVAHLDPRRYVIAPVPSGKPPDWRRSRST